MSSRRDLPQPFNLAKSINSLHYSSSGEILRLVDEVIGSGFAGVTTNNSCLIGDSASDLSARREHTDDQRDPAPKKQERELNRQVSIRDSRRNEKTNLEKGADGNCMSVGHHKSPGFPWTSYSGFERSANEWLANSEPRLSRRQSGKVTDTSLLSCDATEFSATASLQPSIRSLPQIGHLGTGPHPWESLLHIHLSLHDLDIKVVSAGSMYTLSKDKSGYRHLQMKLEEDNPEHRDLIFQEIFPHFNELMTHTFDSISGELVSIALNMHGTRAVQKIIDHLST
ncbi:hypothetical protein BT69DRAFT_1291690 [Atractiella rhizophila]|nr:hypothetical protein BT69DRAFT_1291690 [Atractiella rhizophila]